VERLKAFQRGERPSTIMQQIAKGYSDAQIEALARWFSMQPP
jgi:cytochrome subunit of sulfide dehydrogenase